jgi:hypothetical protein
MEEQDWELAIVKQLGRITRRIDYRSKRNRKGSYFGFIMSFDNVLTLKKK